MTAQGQSPDLVPSPGGARRILQAAEALFAERGYDAVSVTAIAEAAEVSKANVFHHFGSKRELYLAALREACEQITALVAVPERGPTAIKEQLQRFMAAHLAHLHTHGGLMRLVLRELLEPEDDGAKELAEQALGPGFARLVGLIREGQARGELRKGLDPAAAALLMIGADVFFFQVRALLPHLSDVDFAHDSAAYTAALSDLLFGGLTAAETQDV